jgi:hypothetical protein
MENIINDLTVLVENACKSKNNIFGYGIWSHHIKPMIPLGQKLADDYGVLIPQGKPCFTAKKHNFVKIQQN